LRAIVKYVKETVTFPEIVEGKSVDTTEEINVVHAIVKGEDIGEVVNLDTDFAKEGEEIEVELKSVCPHCLDQDDQGHDCMCWYDRYKPIMVVKAVCKCCGKEI